MNKSKETLMVSNQPRPFLKWAGGKKQMLKQYNLFFPKEFKNYIEPFVGAGAVFFHFLDMDYLASNKHILLIDTNDELINCYQVIQEDSDRLISVLSSLKYSNDKDVFYKIRSENPEDRFERAARTIYLNRTCFNGLYRVNSKREFNVPFGKYKNPQICDSENLSAIHLALSGINIVCDDFAKCLDFAGENDFIYFDPPYQPLSKTSNFTSYTKNSFNEEQQFRLSRVFEKLDHKGCKIMMSNSDTALIRELYDKFRIEVVYASRAISCKAEGRGKINELVIMNY